MSVRILLGDCREVLKTLPDASVHCCVTSPPYWGLRSYLPAGHPNKHLEIGSEPTVHEWVATMVEVFREVRRVLRDDGTLWLNLGDSYAGSGRGGNVGNGSSGLAGKQTDHSRVARAHQVFTGEHKAASAAAGRCKAGRGSTLPSGMHAKQVNAGALGRAWTPAPAGLKNKDLIGQPWRVAFALQADGWWLRQEIIWGKKNPMPESCRDRFTKAHEHVFLLTKSERYYFDFDAIQEEASENTHQRRAGTGVGFGRGYDEVEKPRYKTPDGWDTSNGGGGHGSFHKAGREKGAVPQGVGRRQGPPGNPAEKPISPKAAQATTDDAGAYVDGKSERLGRGPGWRNKQNGSFDEAMAVMPATRNPRSVRVVDEDEYFQFLQWKTSQAIAPDYLLLASEPFRGAHYATYPPALIEPFVLAGCPEGGTVLDIFGGSGTTGLVADRHHRNAILIDLDERNKPMATERIAGDAPLFAEITSAEAA